MFRLIRGHPIVKFHFKSGPPQFHTPLSSTHWIHTKALLVFSPQNPLVPHKKALNSTNLSVPHQKPLMSVESSQTVQHIPSFTPKDVWNRGVFGEELRGV